MNDDRAVIEFPTSQIPRNSVISSATMTIYVWHGGGTTGDSGMFRLYGYTGDGVASMADYNAQQVLIKTFREGVPPTWGNTSFDVTAFIQSQINGGALYSGFLFQALSQNVLMGFGCPGPNTFPWPTLDVKYTVVPEPQTFALLLIGGGLIFLKRKFGPALLKSPNQQ
ncbi:MAG TPA: DNRLRE domain-containing protein [Candidatus Paceibacterota bacterium]|nr:DNRLRE domain-containing protein [Candidatus Paceibacterota bacterium]